MICLDRQNVLSGIIPEKQAELSLSELDNSAAFCPLLINLWTLVKFRTAEWRVVRTAPRYLLAGGGSNPSPVPIRSGHPLPRERVGIMCAHMRALAQSEALRSGKAQRGIRGAGPGSRRMSVQ
jgi:hypothetical protein